MVLSKTIQKIRRCGVILEMADAYQLIAYPSAMTWMSRRQENFARLFGPNMRSARKDDPHVYDGEFLLTHLVGDVRRSNLHRATVLRLLNVAFNDVMISRHSSHPPSNSEIFSPTQELL